MAIPETIRRLANDVRTKIYGKDVRESIAKGMEVSGEISNEALSTSNQTKARQDDVENRFDDQIAGNTDIDEVIDARRPEGEDAYSTLGNRLDAEKEIVDENIEFSDRINADLLSRGVSALYPPPPHVACAGDNITDDAQALQNLINTFDVVFLPPVHYRITNTIRVGTGKSLVGLTDNIRDYQKTAVINYDGPEDRFKAVVVVGQNDVADEPASAGSDIVLKNILVHGHYLAGFGVYGTSITNESKIENVSVRGTLEYGFYIARVWFATFERLLSFQNKGRGIALGMPLEFDDGLKIEWNTDFPLQINNAEIRDIRAHTNGRYFIDDAPNTFDPYDESLRKMGYGIGFGLGNSFNIDRFSSEKNGGVGLYVYTTIHPLKTIKHGYLEANCRNSGLDPSTSKASVILENKSDIGGNNILLEDIFIANSDGGIFHTGDTERKIKLKNVHQPRFLKSLDGLNDKALYAVVIKDNVHYQCGYYNTSEDFALAIDVHETVDTIDVFTIKTNPSNCYKLIFIKGDGTTPYGGFTLSYEDGSTRYIAYPNLSRDEYIMHVVAQPNLMSIKKAGNNGQSTSNVTFKVVDTPKTFV